MSETRRHRGAPPEADHPRSLWVATARPEEIEAQALSGDRRADVVIVGGGFTGLRAAIALAEAGAETVVLEAKRIGWGASGRSGGQVNPLPHRTPAEIRQRLPAPFAERFLRTTLRSADELFDFIRVRGLDCEPRQQGWLRVAHCPRAADVLRRQTDDWQRAGADVVSLEGAELAGHVGSDFFAAGALFRRAGCIQPLSYVRTLARCAQAAGALIHIGSPATSIAPVTGGWSVRTPGGRITAEKVILCVNGYADDLHPSLARSIVPLTSVQAATARLPEEAAKEILPHGQTIADSRRTIFYGRREPDGRVVFGVLGRMDEHGGSPDLARLRAAATEVFPALEGVRWEYEWGGRVAKTADHLPHLHEPAPGLLAGLGYNGRGVAMSNVMGRTLAERALGGRAVDSVLPTTPIRAQALRHFAGFGLRAAIRWMEWRDRREIGAPSSPKKPLRTPHGGVECREAPKSIPRERRGGQPERPASGGSP